MDKRCFMKLPVATEAQVREHMGTPGSNTLRGMKSREVPRIVPQQLAKLLNSHSQSLEVVNIALPNELSFSRFPVSATDAESEPEYSDLESEASLPRSRDPYINSMHEQ